MAKPIVQRLNILRRRRTRIIATIGPASHSPKKIDALIAAGVDVFRLNMSHGDYKSHSKTAKTIRQVAKKRKAVVAIMADLCGPKIRVGCFQGGVVQLHQDAKVVVTGNAVIGTSNLIPSGYRNLAHDVSRGDPILLKDGLLELQVLKVRGDELDCIVRRGGELRDHNGLHVPGVRLSSVSCMSARDRKDAHFALGLGVDFMALSFVRDGTDVAALRRLIRRSDYHANIVAKVELAEALQSAEDIVLQSDAIMVARGDLGVELNPEQVPAVQRQLIDIAHEYKKPVIVATQMLESMVSNPRPTRAEVSDVANAVDAGVDAVMLSAETAIGAYPVAAVVIMNKTARETEGWQWQNYRGNPATMKHNQPIMRAIGELSQNLDARCVVVFDDGGHTAAAVSATRPAAPMVVVTSEQFRQRLLLLHWGVVPVYKAHSHNYNDEQRIKLARRLARQLCLAKAGQPILMVSGFHYNPKKNCPTIQAVTT
ncbi:MAG: pyruvate kinase [Candidatus Porifericomitaceae bacterium WSBS_2022_MAG_OTU9]